MGKLGKETKNLLLAITVICLISFLLAAGLSFLLAKDFQHEMLLHDYGVSGYQLNHEDKLQISAFTAHPNESDIERGKEALASIGYSEATSMQLLPTVREYRNQTMLYLFLLLLFLFGMVYLVLLFYLRRQHRAIDDAGSKIREFLDGNSMSRIECSQTGDWYSLFHDVNEMATILSAHAESQKQTKEFLQDIISDVSHQIKTPLSALKMYHEIISSHKGEAETVANFSEKSQREIKRMENVIYTLLKLARLDAGIIQMEKAEEKFLAMKKIYTTLLGMFDDEFPYIVPLHYGYQMEKGKLIFYVHCAKEGHKLECLKENRNVFVEIDRGESLITADIPCKYGAEYESVMCRGKAMIIEDIKEKCKALGVLMKVQTGKEHEIDDKMASAVNVVKIDVESYTAKACIR